MSFGHITGWGVWPLHLKHNTRHNPSLQILQSETGQQQQGHTGSVAQTEENTHQLQFRVPVSCRRYHFVFLHWSSGKNRNLWGCKASRSQQSFQLRLRDVVSFLSWMISSVTHGCEWLDEPEEHTYKEQEEWSSVIIRNRFVVNSEEASNGTKPKLNNIN